MERGGCTSEIAGSMSPTRAGKEGDSRVWDEAQSGGGGVSESRIGWVERSLGGPRGWGGSSGAGLHTAQEAAGFWGRSESERGCWRPGVCGKP